VSGSRYRWSANVVEIEEKGEMAVNGLYGPISTNVTKFKCIKWSRFENMFSPGLLECPLVF
jgi:hypothetical protein